MNTHVNKATKKIESQRKCTGSVYNVKYCKHQNNILYITGTFY